MGKKKKRNRKSIFTKAEIKSIMVFMEATGVRLGEIPGITLDSETGTVLIPKRKKTN